MRIRAFILRLLLVLIGLGPQSAGAQTRLFVQVQPFGQLPSLSGIDLGTGQVEWEAALPYANRVAVTADGRYLLAATTRWSVSGEPPASDLWVKDMVSGGVSHVALGPMDVADLITHPRRLEAYVRSSTGLFKITPDESQRLSACDRPGGVSLSVDGKYLAASCGNDGAREIVVFETTTWTVQHRLRSVSGYLDTLILDTDGSRVFTLEQGAVAVYDAATGDRIRHGIDPPPPTGYAVLSLGSGSPRRDVLFVGAAQYTTFPVSSSRSAVDPAPRPITFERHLYYLVDAETLRVSQQVPSAASVLKVEITPDGRHALVASRGYYQAVLVQLLDLSNNVEVARRVTSPGDGLDIALSAAPLAPDDLSATVASDRSVSLNWDLADWSPATTHYILEAGSGPGLHDLGSFRADDGGPSITVHDVPPGLYWVRIRAANVTGTSPPSADILVTVP